MGKGERQNTTSRKRKKNFIRAMEIAAEYHGKEKISIEEYKEARKNTKRGLPKYSTIRYYYDWGTLKKRMEPDINTDKQEDQDQ